MEQVSDHRFRRDIFSIKEKLEVCQISEVRWIFNQEMLANPLRLTMKGADSKKLDLVLDTGRFFKVEYVLNCDIGLYLINNFGF